MRYVILFILSATTFLSIGQVSSGFTGTVETISSTYIGNGEYSITTTDFRSTQSQYNQFDLAVGQLIWAESRINNPCNKYEILQITYEQNGDITFVARGDGIVGSINRPKDQDILAVVESTEFNQIPLFKASQLNLFGYIAPTLQECMMNDIIINLDSIGTNQIDSIYLNQIDTNVIFFYRYLNGTVETDTARFSVTLNNTSINTDNITIEGNGGNTPLSVKTYGPFATQAEAQAAGVPEGAFFTVTEGSTHYPFDRVIQANYSKL